VLTVLAAYKQQTDVGSPAITIHLVLESHDGRSGESGAQDRFEAGHDGFWLARWLKARSISIRYKS